MQRMIEKLGGGGEFFGNSYIFFLLHYSFKFLSILKLFSLKYFQDDQA
jgi:hypothetical protein